MSVKAVLILCAQLSIIQMVVSQCTRLGVADNYLTSNLQGSSVLSTNGGLINSAPCSNTRAFLKPIGPIEISILADNLILDGNVGVAGSLPFVGTIALEGSVPSSGQASVQYGCGNGEVGIFGLGDLELGLGLERCSCLV